MKQRGRLYKLTIILILIFSSNWGIQAQEKSTKSDPNIPIFEIKNDLGQTIFAVYPGGVKIFVSDKLKATGGGFTVGRLSTGKAVGGDIFTVQPNDVKVILDQATGIKATGGGFTVGRLSTGKATGGNDNFLTVTPDSTRVYIDSSSTAGFAVGKIGTTTGLQNFMYLKKNNYFIGHNSGTKTTGLYNLFLGYESGLSNTTGTNNTFLGYQTGYNNTSGINNVFIGNRSGYSNVNGNYNTFIGFKAGRNTTGGTNAWDGESNTFIGYQAGHNNTLGYRNIAIGYNAGYGLAENRYNVLIGEQSGYNLSTGQANIFMGTYAGQYNNGSSNIFIGLDAGWYNSSGNNNVYIGVGAGRNGQGSDNVFIGNLVGLSSTASNTLLIENSTNTTTPLIYGEFDNNRVVINGNATANPNNRTFYANGTAGGDGAWFNDSDKRLKENIVTIQGALNKVLALRGVNFNWKDKTRGNSLQIGFIAQEAMKIIPEVVDNTNDHYSMQYAPITAILVEAVKEQQKQIEALKEKNETLSAQVSEIDALKAEMTELKAMVKEIAGTTKESKTESAK